MQAQSEAHWRDLAQVKEQATLKESELLAKNEALNEQLKIAQSKVSINLERTSVVKFLRSLRRRLFESILEGGLSFFVSCLTIFAVF